MENLSEPKTVELLKREIELLVFGMIVFFILFGISIIWYSAENKISCSLANVWKFSNQVEKCMQHIQCIFCVIMMLTLLRDALNNCDNFGIVGWILFSTSVLVCTIMMFQFWHISSEECSIKKPLTRREIFTAILVGIFIVLTFILTFFFHS